MTNLDSEVFRKTFQIFDKNGDGSVTSAELGSVFRALGQNLTAAVLTDIELLRGCPGQPC